MAHRADERLDTIENYLWALHLLAKWVYAQCFMLYALLTGKRFYCRALRGESQNNIMIHCDLTVSCVCNDQQGSAYLGDIRTQRLAEIFSGERAHYLRRSLARGRLPLLRCIRCNDIRLVRKEHADRYIYDYHLPSLLAVENTVECNLRCFVCNRELIYKTRKRTAMTLEDVAHVARVIKENNVTMVVYLNVGEPFMSSTIKLELEILRNENPGITLVTSTNGMMLNSDEKREAALYFNHIYFSIDGSTQESIQRYQRNGDFNASYRNMKALVELRNARHAREPVIEWKYVLFGWNDTPPLVSKAISLAREAHVDIISFWPTLVPMHGISLLYYLGLSYARKVGVPCWKGREIDFREGHVVSM